MVAPLQTPEPRGALTVHLQFTRGRHGAGARIELHERPAGRLAVLELRGWIDLSAQRRFEQTLDDLAARGVERLLVDCSAVRHIDYRLVPRLVAALTRFEARSGGVALGGLSRYLRDLFRLAGCDPLVGAFGPADEAFLPSSRQDGSFGERAS
ncbi:MAG: STAS domain-containing protein [Candidatus Eisenbacteria bacterium]|nr:STAS domain-containing protein [Candidatus Eisenbacteria bacterium]